MKETRSRNLVTLLNRLGSSISYNQSQRIITTIADECEQQIQCDGFFIPNNLSQDLTQCAIDNLDFTDLHATTTIFFQYPENDAGWNLKNAQVPLVLYRSQSLQHTIPFEVMQSRQNSCLFFERY